MSEPLSSDARAEDDECLFAAYRQGDMAAFDALYRRYQKSLYLYLLRRGLSESQAQDVFHDCWMQVISHREDYQGGHFRAWIFSIARNRSIDSFRRASIRQAEPLDTQHESHNQAFSSATVAQDLDCLQLLKNSIGALPLDQRDAFLLKQEGGLSLQQIADVMAVGRETIKSRIRYAMQHLKQLLEDCL